MRGQFQYNPEEIYEATEENYRKTKRMLQHLYERTTDKAERQIISGMISDVQFVIDWLRTGRRPGNRRGVERLAAYQRERPMDPLLIQRYFQSVGGDPYEWFEVEKHDTLSQIDRERLEDALSVLTEREKEMYIMSRGYGLSFAEIAFYMNVGKSTVQDTIERAEKKIAKRINESLFCLVG